MPKENIKLLSSKEKGEFSFLFVEIIQVDYFWKVNGKIRFSLFCFFWKMINLPLKKMNHPMKDSRICDKCYHSWYRRIMSESGTLLS